MTDDVHMRDTLPWAYPDFDENQKFVCGEAKKIAPQDFFCVVFTKPFYKHVSNEISHLNT
jgi:hypothetical protein